MSVSVSQENIPQSITLPSSWFPIKWNMPPSVHMMWKKMWFIKPDCILPLRHVPVHSSWGIGFAGGQGSAWTLCLQAICSDTFLSKGNFSSLCSSVWWTSLCSKLWMLKALSLAHSMSFLGPLLVGCNYYILRTPHGIYCSENAWPSHHNLSVLLRSLNFKNCSLVTR